MCWRCLQEQLVAQHAGMAGSVVAEAEAHALGIGAYSADRGSERPPIRVASSTTSCSSSAP